MNMHFVWAGVLAILIGLVHSVLGEWRIFRRMRVKGVVPTNGGSVLNEALVRILWASWHLATVFGLGLAAVMFWLALPANAQFAQSVPAQAVAAAMVAGSALVLFGTKGRHPGWVGLLAVAALVFLGGHA